MADAAAALATPTNIKHGGKEYELSPLTLDMLAMFERWLENRAFEAIQVRKGQVAEDDYERLLSAWVEQCASGRYRWGSRTAQRAARTKDGMGFLFFVQLAAKNQAMSQRLATEIMESQLAEYQAKVEVVNAGPFAASPVETPKTDSA